MRIFVTGTRGIPDIPGGVETHCQNLYPIIARKGHKILLSRRRPYVKIPRTEWRGIQLIDVYSPKSKSMEAIVHTFLSILKAKSWRADVVHIHAIGPSLVTPFARLLGLKVVVTNHGPDYDRMKWGRVAKFFLRLGEYLGGRFANKVIVISEHIRCTVRVRCGRESVLIYNGVRIPEVRNDDSFLREYGLEKGGYLFTAARLVPEKGLHDLIHAFESMDTSLKLVIAGDCDFEDEYVLNLKQIAGQNANIILTGYVIGENLAQLFSHARLFVLPSYHEGLPIALLEALSYGLKTVVSDIPAHKELVLDPEMYFRCGDVDNLSRVLSANLESGWNEENRSNAISFVKEKYNWDTIADQTVMVYKKC